MQAEIDDSNAQYRRAWRLFALGRKAGEVVERPEVFIAASHVRWAMMNAAFLQAPAGSEQALEAAAASAARYFSTGRHRWTFIVSNDWLPAGVQENAGAILARYGLEPLMAVTGMVAERLQEPARPLPPLDIRPVRDAWGRQAVADINSACNYVRREVGREAFDVESLYGPDTRGFVVCRDDTPVSSAVMQRVDGTVYMSLVATLPAHRRMGAAEAAMRHALAEAREAWGIERTVLHASEAGYPIYLRMGYRPVTRFHIYIGPAPEPA